MDLVSCPGYALALSRVESNPEFSNMDEQAGELPFAAAMLSDPGHDRNGEPAAMTMALGNGLRSGRFFRVLVIVLAMFAAGTVQAKRDHDHARELSEAGEILPLESILKKVQQVYPGRVLEVDLERKHGRLVYEIELVDEQGVVRELYYDAATGDLLRGKRDHR